MIDLHKIAEESRASIEKEDLKILLPLVAKINPKNILEIGTWKGYSAETWIKAFKPDIFITIEKDDISIHEYNVHTNIGYKSWYNSDSHDPKVLRDVKIYSPEGFNYFFIDGDHSYEGVRKDFEMYSPLVKKGGIIALHDTCYHADKTEEVDIFWNEIKNKYPYVEIKAGKNSTGIGIIFV